MSRVTTQMTPTGSAPALGDGARAWWPAGLAVAAVAWGANQFSPLLLLYRAELGLSALAVDAAFGLYALGLIPGLFVGGPLSDRLGRRLLVLPALVVSLVASLLLTAGGDLGVGWLFAGRLVAGVASGAAFSAGTAWIKELSGSGGGTNHGPRRATIAMSAGFAGGPLIAGLLAQWAPWPAVLPYLPHLVLAVLALILAARARRPTSRARAGRCGGRCGCAGYAIAGSSRSWCRWPPGCSDRPRWPWPTYPVWCGTSSAPTRWCSARWSPCSARWPASSSSRSPAGSTTAIAPGG
jgi:MFS family permease